MTKKLDARDKLSLLQGTGYFTPESLLQEIITGMSMDEAKSMFDHICRHYDIDGEQVGEY